MRDLLELLRARVSVVVRRLVCAAESRTGVVMRIPVLEQVLFGCSTVAVGRVGSEDGDEKRVSL